MGLLMKRVAGRQTVQKINPSPFLLAFSGIFQWTNCSSGYYTCPHPAGQLEHQEQPTKKDTRDHLSWQIIT